MLPSRSSAVLQKPAKVSQLKTSSSDLDRPLHRPITDRSSKLGDRRPSRGTQSAPATQKKLGTRIAGLESQLGQAQEELKILKEQLASTDAAKPNAQGKVERTARKRSVSLDPKDLKEKAPQHFNEIQVQPPITSSTDNIPDEHQEEMDVFEVPMEKKAPSVCSEKTAPLDEEDEVETKSMDIPSEPAINLELEKTYLEDLELKDEEINLLKGKLEEKEKELESHSVSNEELRNQLSEATTRLSAAQIQEENLEFKISQLTQELQLSKEKTIKISKRLEAIEALKESQETEMKQLRVQTEQWRKAADAASAVLAGENGRSMSFNGLYESPLGTYDEFGSPGFADDMNSGGAKKKGSGIKMFGDLWKKKVNK